MQMSTGAHRKKIKKKKNTKNLQACGLPTLVTQLNYQREKDPAQVSGLCSILLHLFVPAILSVCAPGEPRDEYPPPWSVLYLTNSGHSLPACPTQACPPMPSSPVYLFPTAMPQLPAYGFGHGALATHHNCCWLFWLLSLVFWRLFSSTLSISHANNLLSQNVLLLARNLQIRRELVKWKGPWVWSQYWR